MGQILHGRARTTAAVRRAIRHSQESLIVLSRRHGINPKTVAKWKRRTSVSELPTGPKDDSHAQLSAHLDDFIDADNYGRRLKTLKRVTPFEYICKMWTTGPDRFTLNPTHQMPRPNCLGHARGACRR